MNKDTNKTQLVGRAAAEPEIRFTQAGVMVASFSMYTNESWKDQAGNWQNRSERHNVVAWASRAEYAKELIKGQRVEVEGKLQTRSWDGADGVKHYRTEINATLVRSGQNEQAPDESEEAAPMTVEDLPF